VPARARRWLERLSTPKGLGAPADGFAAKPYNVVVHRTRPYPGATPVSFLLEIWSFLLARKKFWLIPIVLAMVVLGGLVVLTKGSAVAPFIYTLF
jgi:hypothetical protein